MYSYQLKTFIRVADVGSFSKAAEELLISPPAVIKQMNALESELEVSLFIRTHRGLMLTDAGKSFYKDAKYILQYFADSIKRAQTAEQRNDHILRIGTSPMTPGQFLIDLWPQIHPYLPDMKFQLVPFENTPENAREVQNFGQKIDLCVGVLDDRYLQERKCAATMLSVEPFRVAVPIRHRLASRNILTMEDMAGENLMLIRRDWNTHMDALRDDITNNYPNIHIVTMRIKCRIRARSAGKKLAGLSRPQGPGTESLAAPRTGRNSPFVRAVNRKICSDGTRLYQEPQRRGRRASLPDRSPANSGFNFLIPLVLMQAPPF